MTLTNFRTERGADGILVATWDMPGRSMNVIDAGVMAELDAIIDEVAGNAELKGAVLASGKDAFSGGADLSMIDGLLGGYPAAFARDPEGANRRLFEESRRLSQLFRKLETCGKPFVMAINGTALGGAFELALSCHGRVAAENPATKLGLPEVKVGLLPGAGGTQRLPRMVPAGDALRMMLTGQEIDVRRAAAAKIVDKVVPADRLIEEAKALIAGGLSPVKPWDQKGFKLPGGPVYSKQGTMVFPPANALYRKETQDNYPNARGILACVYEGLLVDFDTGLRIESRHFAAILTRPEAPAMIRTLFLNMQALNKLARRPPGIPASKPAKIGVLGAGFMGAGIAYVTAAAGIDVVLIDRDEAAAAKGRDHAQKLMTERVNKGRATTAEREALLQRIQPTADYAALAGCDLVIEAVFEDRAVKAEATRKAEAHLGPGAVFGSNTSTLPISGLAQASARPENFIGVHFFSPVEKMMLVEIIMGEKTSDAALARALDYCRAIRKTPIVVNDSRGFYTSRVVSTYIGEGLFMLSEGLPAALVENTGRMAGMPVGPLSLADEVGLDVAYKIAMAAKRDLGADYVETARDTILEELVARRGRHGRKNGKGFYDYPERGRKSLWPDLPQVVPVTLDITSEDVPAVDIEELKSRYLVVQALETARIFEEGVLTDVRDADVGAILGFGYAPFTGGPLSWIDSMGAAAFVALCRRLAARHGDRFEPNRLLLEMAERGETFYTRFAPGEAVKAA